ncbi:hypothetical protein M0Q50_05820 [bacterium]|jgi:hypothetical protein|nr:hypothetical protein [bacterium]
MESQDKNLIASNKINTLLGIRDSLKSSMINNDRLIKEGLLYIKDFPQRWYVWNPEKTVIDYLNNKYNTKFVNIPEVPRGFGELHGQIAVIPHDIKYAWEITQEEFDYIMKLKSE